MSGDSDPSFGRPISRSDLVFLDFEASGFQQGSWPIEIGLARVHDGGQISVHESLIRPAEHWPEDRWSPASARVHGISREELDGAFSADLVAADFLELLIDKVIISDAPEYDQRWLDMLAHLLASRSGISTGPSRRSVSRVSSRPTRSKLSRYRTAGGDAGRLARAWLAAATAAN